MVREGELVARDWEEWYREERKAIEDVPNMDAILFICFFLCVVIYRSCFFLFTRTRDKSLALACESETRLRIS